MNARALAPLLVLALAATGCGVNGEDDADHDDGGGTTSTTTTAVENAVEPYSRDVATAALTLGGAVEELFATPLGLETEAIAERLFADGTPTGEITAAEEATMREFFATFWTDAAGHVAVMGEALRAIDPPDSVRAEHEAYVAALDAVVESTEDRVAEVQARDATDLGSILWEPDEALEAVEVACQALRAEAASHGVDAETCP